MTQWHDFKLCVRPSHVLAFCLPPLFLFSHFFLCSLSTPVILPLAPSLCPSLSCFLFSLFLFSFFLPPSPPLFLDLSLLLFLSPYSLSVLLSFFTLSVSLPLLPPSLLCLPRHPLASLLITFFPSPSSLLVFFPLFYFPFYLNVSISLFSFRSVTSWRRTRC